MYRSISFVRDELKSDEIEEDLNVYPFMVLPP